MILCNKYITTKHVDAVFLLLLQTAGSVVIYVVVMALLPRERRQMDTAAFLHVAPLTFFFLCMLYTSIQSILNLSVPTLIVFKNFTAVFTLIGDSYTFHGAITHKKVSCILVMTMGAVAASYEDMDFNITGLLYVLVNCLCQSIFSVLSKVVQERHGLTPMTVSTCNNVLSCCTLLGCVLATQWGDFCMYLAGLPALPIADKSILGLSCFMGALVAVSQFWCVLVTNPFHMCILGTVNKVPVMVLGALVFETNITLQGWVFLVISLVSGAIYSMEQQR